MAGYKTMEQLQAALNKSISIAVEKTAKEAEDMLKKCVNEQYYKDPGFYPNVYERTETFLYSVAMTTINNKADIYIDINGMHYKNGFSPWQVVSWASESKHGAEYYQTGTEDFWSRFIDWCNENLIKILKENIQKQGIRFK